MIVTTIIVVLVVLILRLVLVAALVNTVAVAVVVAVVLVIIVLLSTIEGALAALLIAVALILVEIVKRFVRCTIVNCKTNASIATVAFLPHANITTMSTKSQHREIFGGVELRGGITLLRGSFTGGLT